VGLAVVGRHVPQLAFLEVLLGDRPVLSPSARLYQRLVAADREDAARMTRAYQEEHGFARLCDDLLLPALRQAEEDAHEELLDETRIGGVYEGLFEIVEEAALRDAEAAKTEAAAPGPTAAALAGAVVCIPARDDADVIAAMMLTALLRRAGHDARSLTLANLGEDMGSLLGEAAPRAVCISAVPPFAARSARIRRRQVELRAPGVPVLTGLWIGDRAETTPTEPTADPDGTGRARRESVITSFSEMVSRVTAIRTPENPAPEEGGATPPEPAKLGGGTGEGPAEIDSPRGEARLA
jgi:hypothetical protein